MAFKAHFKTAYDQRELPLELAVKGDLHVGYLVKLTPDAGDVPAYIEAATSLADATHIVAQSDMTLEYGHVPIENVDYKYKDIVASTTSGAPTNTTETKRVALYPILDKDDLIVVEVE